MLQTKKNVVIGVGNILFMDEGVGVYASRSLKENYTFEPHIDIVDGGTLGFKLMDYFQDYERVIILDTVSIKDKPGSVYNLPAEALMGLSEYKQTVHELEVVGMLELSSMLEEVAEVSVIGIIPEDIQSVEMNLSDTLRKQMPLLIEETLKSLAHMGVSIVKKSVDKDIDNIIDLYKYPSAIQGS